MAFGEQRMSARSPARDVLYHFFQIDNVDAAIGKAERLRHVHEYVGSRVHVRCEPTVKVLESPPGSGCGGHRPAKPGPDLCLRKIGAMAHHTRKDLRPEELIEA